MEVNHNGQNLGLPQTSLNGNSDLLLGLVPSLFIIREENVSSFSVLGTSFLFLSNFDDV